jgi:hypothetical protein
LKNNIIFYDYIIKTEKDNKQIPMSEFWGLVLFGTLVGLGLAAGISLIYCGCIALCRLRRPEPLASAENVV